MCRNAAPRLAVLLFPTPYTGTPPPPFLSTVSPSIVRTSAPSLPTPPKTCARNDRAGKRLTKLSRQVGSSAAKEVTTFASSATGWGGNQLRQWGLLGDDPDAVGESPGVFGGLLKSKKKLAGGRGSASAKRRPLGFSVVLDGVFGERSRSIYSAPPAGGSRKPGYRGDPVIPVRQTNIKHWGRCWRGGASSYSLALGHLAD